MVPVSFHQDSLSERRATSVRCSFSNKSESSERTQAKECKMQQCQPAIRSSIHSRSRIPWPEVSRVVRISKPWHAGKRVEKDEPWKGFTIVKNIFALLFQPPCRSLQHSLLIPNSLQLVLSLGKLAKIHKYPASVRRKLTGAEGKVQGRRVCQKSTKIVNHRASEWRWTEREKECTMPDAIGEEKKIVSVFGGNMNFY
ncbi:aminophospholipid translocase, putative [Anopheles sinensis]|uniref:Aminophospholipid translocase, putative n=1 Tax=Anopheles sinensis TaxID=74873 RepID=A0A084VE46_ANOSI|nr:aminophospholipid translocase, putative [Anopheles sinensis]